MLGREQEIQRIKEKLQAGNHCSLVGPPGSGRSHLLREIQKDIPSWLGCQPQAILSLPFRGIWAQAGEAPQGQHPIFTALAPHLEGLERGALQQTSGFDDHAFNAALDALQRHDVVTINNSTCRYTVELMRRWVVAWMERSEIQE
ncbi:MAG: hypothetical protein AB7P69_26775 [Candidatus Binatia bacterium]